MTIQHSARSEDERILELLRLSRYDECVASFLDGITQLAAKVFNVEYCLISFIDRKSQLVKSCFGSDLKEIPREISICGHAILQNEILIIQNVLLDHGFSGNPLLATGSRTVFYAGVPLVTTNGYKIGALSIISLSNKIITNLEKELLQNFSNQIIEKLEHDCTKKYLDVVSKQYEDIQLLSQTGEWELDLDTSATLWSSEVYNIYQIPRNTPTDKIIGLDFYKIPDRERLSSIIDRSISDGTSFDGEFEFVDANGVEKWVRSRGYPFFGEDNKIKKIIGTIQDVTLQKRDQLELVKRSSEIEAYAKSLNNYALVTKANVDGKITFANDMFCLCSGYTLDELIGKDHRIVSSGYHNKDFFSHMWSTVRSGSQWRGEIKNRSKNGGIFWTETIITPIFNDQGVVSEFFSFRFDISEKKDLDIKLKKGDIEHKLLFEQAFDAIMTLNPPDWIFSSANPATLKLFGFTENINFLSLGPWDVSPEFQPDGQRSSQKAKEMIKLAIENGSHYFEWTHSKMDGTEMLCNVLLSKIIEGESLYLNATVRDISNEKRIESQLIEAQAISKVGSWCYNIKTNELEWSREHYKIFEVSYPQPTNELFNFYIERIHSDDWDTFDKLMKRAITLGEEFIYDHRILVPGKKIKYVQVIVKIVKDAHKNIVLLNGTCRDRSNDIEKEQSYRNLMESISKGIIVQDNTGAVIDFNAAAMKIFELDSHQILGKEPLGRRWRIVKKNGLEMAVQDHPGLVTLRTGVPIVNLILGLKFLDGRIKWICINTNPIKDSGGKKVISTVSDITDVVAAKEENQFVLDSIGIGIWKYNPQSKELSWDDSMYRLFSVNPEDFTDHYQAWESTLTAESKQIAIKELNDAISGLKDFDTTFEIHTQNNQRRFIGGKAMIIRDKEGVAQMMYGINWDRTKEIELEKSLDMERAKSFQNARLASIGQLAAGVGHEINNPLAIIAGHLSIAENEIKRKDFNLDSIVARFHKIGSAIVRISNIVNTLRNFSKSDDEDFVAFDPYDLLEETLEMMSDLYDRDGFKIVLLGEHQKMLVDGNRSRMQQVFINLLNNAKDSMLDVKDRIIKVVVKYENDNVKIIFSDSGCGVPEHLREKIFIPFFTTKKANKGTGIGLSLVSTIVREHEGSIELNSQIDVGSDFIVVLPIKNSLPGKLKPEKTKFPSRNKISCKVLIVDDEADLREICFSVFSKICTHVVVVGSAKEGLALMKNNNFDLIISDIQMPVVDGFGFFKTIRENRHTSNVSFMFMSGGVSFSEENQKIINDNSLIVLAKPIEEIKTRDILEEIFMKK